MQLCFCQFRAKEFFNRHACYRQLLLTAEREGSEILSDCVNQGVELGRETEVRT